MVIGCVMPFHIHYDRHTAEPSQKKQEEKKGERYHTRAPLAISPTSHVSSYKKFAFRREGYYLLRIHPTGDEPWEILLRCP